MVAHVLPEPSSAAQMWGSGCRRELVEPAGMSLTRAPTSLLSSSGPFPNNRALTFFFSLEKESRKPIDTRSLW